MSIRDVVADGFMNVFSGIGSKRRDRTRGNRTTGREFVSDQSLADIYAGDGLGRKIIQAMADDAVRQWIEVDGDANGDHAKYQKRIKMRKAIHRALAWSRAFGGALIVAGIRDGREIHEPRAATWQSADWLRVYDRRRVPISTHNYDTDPNSDRFGEIEFYEVQPHGGHPFRVHHTRAVQVLGEELPEDIVLQWFGWGQPIMQTLFDSVASTDIAFRAVANIMQEMIVGKYRFSGLREMIESGREDEVVRRMGIIERGKSVINAVLLDADGEEYDRDSVTMSGVADALDRIMMWLAGQSEYPVTRLFGRSAAGMNSTGENDMRGYYDAVADVQSTKIADAVDWLAHLINDAGDGPGIPDMSWRFRPLWQLDDTQRAEMHLNQARADAVYLENMVLSPDEVARSRFGGDGFSLETEIETETRAPLTPPDEEE